MVHRYDRSLRNQTTMANFNKVILLGNLTRDIEVRYTQGGLAIAKFGMAINRRWKSQDGENREETCFADCRIVLQRVQRV